MPPVWSSDLCTTIAAETPEEGTAEPLADQLVFNMLITLWITHLAFKNYMIVFFSPSFRNPVVVHLKPCLQVLSNLKIRCQTISQEIWCLAFSWTVNLFPFPLTKSGKKAGVMTQSKIPNCCEVAGIFLNLRETLLIGEFPGFISWYHNTDSQRTCL